MRREKARLEELRAMSYEQYLQTPEWQETQKAALKRAGNRCQVCRQEVTLRAYHTSLGALGCELESDVIALCEACYDHLAQKLQRFAEQTADQADDFDEGPIAPHFSLARKALVFTPSAIVLDGLFALLHAPLPAELFGLGVAIALAANSPKIYANIRESLPEPWQEYLDARATRRQERAAHGEWSVWDRLLGRHLYTEEVPVPALYLQSGEEPLEDEELEQEEETGLFRASQQAAPLAIARVTVEEICAHIQRNSYAIYVGRSLTEEGSPAVPLQIYKQHISIIGVTQRGKSSMAAALMEIITRTHDPEYVQLALLDHENQTSNLFAHLPHVMTWRGTRLHARTPEEVVDHLELLLEIMEYRYTLPAQERANLPVLLVYLEEFLALKKELRLAIATLKEEKNEEKLAEAKKRYAKLVKALNLIALRGLKARVQFLLCAQVDYADNEFREAMAMFNIRFSFGVDPDAARAAGFTANDLLNQNSKSKEFGEAVIEAPATKDLLLAPDFPVEQRLIEMEAKRARQWPDQQRPAPRTVPETPTPNGQKVYHTHEGAGQLDRKQARLQRLRGNAPQIAPTKTRAAGAAPVGAPTAEQLELDRPFSQITDLTAYLKPEQHIPTLEEVVAAFPNQLPSKQRIAKHFDITDHQAYKLFKQLEARLKEEAGRVVGRSDEERMVKN